MYAQDGNTKVMVIVSNFNLYLDGTVTVAVYAEGDTDCETDLTKAVDDTKVTYTYAGGLLTLEFKEIKAKTTYQITFALDGGKASDPAELNILPVTASPEFEDDETTQIADSTTATFTVSNEEDYDDSATYTVTVYADDQKKAKVEDVDGTFTGGDTLTLDFSRADVVEGETGTYYVALTRIGVTPPWGESALSTALTVQFPITNVDIIIEETELRVGNQPPAVTTKNAYVELTTDWDPKLVDGKFSSKGPHTLTITLTPTDGAVLAEDAEYTLSGNTGDSITGETDDNGKQTGTITIDNINVDPAQYLLTVEADGNGSVTVTTAADENGATVEVKSGTSAFVGAPVELEITARPAPGYAVDSVKCNGIDVTSSAEGSTIVLKVAPVAESALSETQKEAVPVGASVVDVGVFSNNVPIHDFNNGRITISLAARGRERRRRHGLLSGRQRQAGGLPDKLCRWCGHLHHQTSEHVFHRRQGGPRFC